ncbi:MAG: STT3 domain-containing protein, partial [Deltaproteobacteria bacterium]|nr:STT3 domain-containing protein [Deltaproteobacteria bacterium]
MRDEETVPLGLAEKSHLKMGKLHSIGALFAILALGLAVRVSNFRGVFVGSETFLLDTDPYYHLRRAWLTATHYPHVPSFDYYVNFPEGAPILWPPGFDFLIATLARLYSQGAPTLDQTAQVAVWVPIVFALLTVLTVFFAAREAFGKRAGLVAALFVSLVELFRRYSDLGYVDHHCAEIFFYSLVLCLLLQSLRVPKGAPFAVAGGASLAAGHLFGTSGILPGVLLTAAALFVAAAGWREVQRQDDGTSILSRTTLLIGSASIFYLP